MLLHKNEKTIRKRCAS